MLCGEFACVLHVAPRDRAYLPCLDRDHIEGSPIEREDLDLVGGSILVDMHDRPHIASGKVACG